MKSPNILLSLAAAVSTQQGVAVPKRYCHVKKAVFRIFVGGTLVLPFTLFKGVSYE